VMNFTMLTKRGNRQQVRQLAIPSESALAVQTRSAQEQDKVEQQHLKRLVLDYEQREEAEEIKGVSIVHSKTQNMNTHSALEAKARAIKIRLAG
jgi:regulator of nonsense transcripts 2